MTSESDARPLVVVGVDGSEGSLAALRWAALYGAATKTPVKAVLVWHYPTAAALPPVGHLPAEVEQEVEGEERPPSGRRSPRWPRTRPGPRSTA
jgi:Universal stress protein family